MPRTRATNTDAILLRSIPYRDADRIVTLLTRDFGKIAVLARNARVSRRRFAGSLEPYAVIRAEVGIGKGEIGTLTAAHIERSFPRILASLDAMTRAGHALELLRELVPERERDERIFRAAIELLEQMNDTPDRAATVLAAFAVRVMSLAGFEPELECCGKCGKRAPTGQAALFDARSGTVFCRACGGAALRLPGPLRERLLISKSADWRNAFTAEVDVDAAVQFATLLVQHQLDRDWPRSGVS